METLSRGLTCVNPGTNTSTEDEGTFWDGGGTVAVSLHHESYVLITYSPIRGADF